MVSAPATRAVYQIVGHIFCPGSWLSSFSKCWYLRLPPVQFSRLIVGSLVSALATCAVYRSDGWILGPSTAKVSTAQAGKANMEDKSQGLLTKLTKPIRKIKCDEQY